MTKDRCELECNLVLDHLEQRGIYGNDAAVVLVTLLGAMVATAPCDKMAAMTNVCCMLAQGAGFDAVVSVPNSPPTTPQ